MFMVNQLIGFGAGVGGAASFSYINHYEDTADASTHDVSISLGTAAVDRKILIAFGSASSAGTVRTVSSAVIHIPDVATDPTGTPMTLVLAGAGASEYGSEWWQANNVASGTAGVVRVVHSSTCIRIGLSVYSATGAASAASDTASTNTDAGSPDLSTLIDVPSGGFILAATFGATNGTQSWGAALTENHDTVIEAGAVTHSSASSASVSSQTNVAVTATLSTFQNHILVAVAYGPA